MNTKTITGKTTAWLTSNGPEDLSSDNHSNVVADALAYSNTDMSACGWTKVGEATITVTIPDERTLIENKIESLRAERTKVMAEAQMRSTEIEVQIQKLLAITYTPEAA